MAIRGDSRSAEFISRYPELALARGGACVLTSNAIAFLASFSSEEDAPRILLTTIAELRLPSSGTVLFSELRLPSSGTVLFSFCF